MDILFTVKPAYVCATGPGTSGDIGGNAVTITCPPGTVVTNITQAIYGKRTFF